MENPRAHPELSSMRILRIHKWEADDEEMAPIRISSGPDPIMMTHGQLNSGLAPSPIPIVNNAPSTSHSLSSLQVHPPVFPQGVAAGPTIEDTSITQADLHPSVNPVAGEPSSAQSTSGDVSLAEPNQVSQPPDHLRKWTKDHPLDNIIGNPSRPVSTRKQLASDALWCCFHTELSKVEPKNFKMAVIEDCCSVSCKGISSGKKGIDFEKRLAPVVMVEAIRNIIANADNQEYDPIYRWIVKTVFLNGDLKEEFLCSQPDGFEDQSNLSLVYRVKKDLYRAKAGAPWACRPDLVIAVCMCARYQAKPTKKHLEAIKRIFRYKDADHAGVRIEEGRYVGEGSVLLRDRLVVTWSSKKKENGPSQLQRRNKLQGKYNNGTRRIVPMRLEASLRIYQQGASHEVSDHFKDGDGDNQFLVNVKIYSMVGKDEFHDDNPPPPLVTPTQQAFHTLSTIKLPILKKGEYDIWAMKMEHYLGHTDYPIWEIIQKGNGPVQVSTDTNGQIKVLPPKIAEEILATERERKARTTLLMDIPEDHLAKFHKMTDAKEMWEAIKSRFGGNDESKKMQKYILKEHFESQRLF
ncbi:ribonuclease H-like domain-containing protein [Tanacetum coccineum]